MQNNEYPFEKTKEQIGNLGNTSITKIVYNNDKEKFDVIYLGK